VFLTICSLIIHDLYARDNTYTALVVHSPSMPPQDLVNGGVP